VQLTSDGLKLYLDAIEDVFGADVDYAQLVKLYGASGENETRYSPAKCIGCISKEITGSPDPKHISTSYVERQNLTMRMHMRRFTRLTNGFSKKLENHVHMIAIYAVSTILPRFTRRYASRLRCRPDSRIMSGAWKKSSGCSKRSRRRFRWLSQTETLPRSWRFTQQFRRS
jgi:hypothetical protein